MSYQPGDLIGMYIKLRDQKKGEAATSKETNKSIDEKMNLLISHLAKFLDDHGGNSFPTDQGTVYRGKKIAVGISDWNLLLDHIFGLIAEDIIEMLKSYPLADDVDTRNQIKEVLAGCEAFSYFKKDVVKEVVLEYVKENNNFLPPGVSYNEWQETYVKSPTKKAGK
ncbi:MAG: hypothetical protein KAS32_02155 [Candidatus Peribacteraceae bacterium]|nr:hypothetical protein [Candidatus Peribacteraceae bacterium]